MKRIWSCDVILTARLPDGSERKREFKDVRGTNPQTCRERAIALLYEQLAREGVEGPAPIVWTYVGFNFEE